MRSKTRVNISWLSGFLALLLALLLAACSSPAPNFNIALSPTSLTVQQGDSGSTTLTLTPQNGFTGTVALSLVDAGTGNAVPGITLSPTSFTVNTSSPVNQTLTVNVANSVPTGNYNLKVKAVSGSINKEANLSLNVTAGGGGGGAGTTWTLRSSGGTDLSGVAHGNSLFVAVGKSGTILTSPDGVSWNQQTSGTSSELKGVAHGNSLFVAVGKSGTILTSP